LSTTTVSATKGKRAKPRPVAARAGVRAATPNPNRLLNQRSIWLFGAFAIAMVIAFWPSYFSRLDQQPTYHPHAHGLAMTAWCVLLISQAWLMRTGRRELHRGLGALSYVVVPLMVVTTINFVHFRLRGAPVLDPVALYFLALVVNALAAFLVLYGMAIYHRRRPAPHARWMVCTIFPLFTPVTDRLFGRYLPEIVPLVPRIDGSPVLPVAGFLLADLVLAGLALWDWRAHRRADVFPAALGVLLLYHVSVLTFHRIPAWQAFAAWFVALPLS
jgi:hypothetical protein